MARERFKLGFTGSREIGTKSQIRKLYDFIGVLDREFKVDNFISIDGMCVGMDEVFYKLCSSLQFNTVGIPGFEENNPLRTKLGERKHLIEDFIGNPLERNKKIVSLSDLMVACPKTEEEELRSGTWSTIRYCRKLDKSLIIIYPSGEIKLDQNELYKNLLK